MALLLPLTFGMPPVTAIVMLAGIMYGGMYGGTLTSVLVNVPGESASVMTAVDGYQIARRGRAGAALSIAAIGSFLAGIAAVAALRLHHAAAQRVRAQVQRARNISCSPRSASPPARAWAARRRSRR